jgi:hypothetical protein
LVTPVICTETAVELPSATGVAIVTVPAAVDGIAVTVVLFTVYAEAAEGKVVEAGALIVMVSPIASAPFALVVKPTVQVALPAPTSEDGPKDTPETTEPKLSPPAGFEAVVSTLVETLNEVFA